MGKVAAHSESCAKSRTRVLEAQPIRKFIRKFMSDEDSTGTVTIELELRGPGFVHLRGIIHQEEGVRCQQGEGFRSGGGFRSGL